MLDSGLAIRRSQNSRTQPSPDGSCTTLDEHVSGKENWALTPESFNGLLHWLDHDRDQAGLRYEEIRVFLVKRFRQLGADDPEELANRTFDRVAKKLPTIRESYEGPAEPYFCSTAYYIHLEYLRKPITLSLATWDFQDPVATIGEEVSEKELLDSCLGHCLGKLNQESRDMILQYYRGDRQVKIRIRKALAEQLGIGLPTLRLRAQRVRAALKNCILDCLERKASEQHTLM